MSCASPARTGSPATVTGTVDTYYQPPGGNGYGRRDEPCARHDRYGRRRSEHCGGCKRSAADRTDARRFVHQLQLFRIRIDRQRRQRRPLRIRGRCERCRRRRDAQERFAQFVHGESGGRRFAGRKRIKSCACRSTRPRRFQATSSARIRTERPAASRRWTSRRRSIWAARRFTPRAMDFAAAGARFRELRRLGRKHRLCRFRGHERNQSAADGIERRGRVRNARQHFRIHGFQHAEHAVGTGSDRLDDRWLSGRRHGARGAG